MLEIIVRIIQIVNSLSLFFSYLQKKKILYCAFCTKSSHSTFSYLFSTNITPGFFTILPKNLPYAVPPRCISTSKISR